ncbi:hypothetical protein RvY_09371 [Ramazzottius varieornatus]|uniref:Uncharacterized protein n=1 Tax=Ramazzottius varieornatus TaxID=947166 RepID=A0A1D1VDP5_RAMVA|nr:hypothetical protein RvY_09371 [Ramazzottius varieornatus]
MQVRICAHENVLRQRNLYVRRGGRMTVRVRCHIDGSHISQNFLNPHRSFLDTFSSKSRTRRIARTSGDPCVWNSPGASRIHRKSSASAQDGDWRRVIGVYSRLIIALCLVDRQVHSIPQPITLTWNRTRCVADTESS